MFGFSVLFLWDSSFTPPVREAMLNRPACEKRDGAAGSAINCIRKSCGHLNSRVHIQSHPWSAHEETARQQDLLKIG
jgi:hypothetical protein